MTRFSFIECCHWLAIDPKTLRQWLAQAQISLHPHPHDARIKCLTREQVQTLARLHGRVLQAPVEGLATASASAGSNEVPSRVDISEADLRARLAQMEAQVATLQTQLTDLALQLRKRAATAHRTAGSGSTSSTDRNGRARFCFSGWLCTLRAIPASGVSIGVPSHRETKPSDPTDRIWSQRSLRTHVSRGRRSSYRS